MEFSCKFCNTDLSLLSGTLNYCPYCSTPTSNSCTECNYDKIENDFAYCPSCGATTDYFQRGLVDTYIPY